MDETGRVVAAGDSRVEVEIVPGDACRTCGAAGICNWTGDRRKLVTARNEAGARIGDSVVVRTPEAGRVRSAALVFGIPAAGMVAGAVGGTLAGRDIWAAAGATAGLLAGAAVLGLIERGAKRSGSSLPVAVRLAEAGEVESCKGGVDEAVGAGGRGVGGDDGLR
jgi:positive regulator of sigma E activity